MILVVAPYSGDFPENTQFLAGSKKIRSVIKILSRIDSDIVLLNTGHQIAENRPQKVEVIDFDGQCLIRVVTPATNKNPYLGRLFNIANAYSITEVVIGGFGVPDVAWFYNGYAFEMRVARFLNKNFGTKTVIEFEDWHFARNRGFNPKPYLDWLFWCMAIKHFDVGFAVNEFLAKILTRHNIPTTLLPSIVSPLISKISHCSPPFQSDLITVGYFGGLCEEKGATALLNLAKTTNENVHFIITGSGDLESEFQALSKAQPERFQFLGAVSEYRLANAISQADLIINAHHVNNGVFPFKVIEALASGRLLISTELPMHGYEDFSEAIQFYDGNEATLFNLVSDSFKIYQCKMAYIIKVAEKINAIYGEHSLVDVIRKQLR